MTQSGHKTLVLGGARSGKSRHAELMADGWEGPLYYIATAQAHDEEMAERIREHQMRRGDNWVTVGAMLDLATPLRDVARDDVFVLVDCLTLWLTNVLLAERDCETAIAELVDAVCDVPGKVVLVSNEVGLGIVPDNALGRRFRDVAGQANQRVAEVCDEVIFMAAGLPMTLKSPTT